MVNSDSSNKTTISPQEDNLQIGENTGDCQFLAPTLTQLGVARTISSIIEFANSRGVIGIYTVKYALAEATEHLELMAD